MKRYLTGTALALACMGLGALLAGFVPGHGLRPPEWRGRVSGSLSGARLPLADVVAQDAERHRLNRVPEEPARVADARDASFPLYLDGWTVGILTENGPAVASAPRGLPGAALPQSPLRHVVPAAGEGELLTPDGHPVRWARQGPGPGGPVCFTLPTLKLDLPEAGFRALSMPARASRYQESVERYARKYGLDTSLVLAIMQIESGFNPTLISARDAHGLMQVVPATAGDEVHRWLGRSGIPTASELLNPDNNIRYGTAYLHLLRTRHFEGVRDPQILEYCVIAAYNGGSGAVLRHFGRTREEAVAALNELSPQDVLTRLTESFPARETRAFVRKVLASRRQFLASGGPAAPVAASVVAKAPVRDAAPAVPTMRADVEKQQRAQLEALRGLSASASSPAAASTSSGANSAARG